MAGSMGGVVSVAGTVGVDKASTAEVYGADIPAVGELGAVTIVLLEVGSALVVGTLDSFVGVVMGGAAIFMLVLATNSLAESSMWGN